MGDLLKMKYRLGVITEMIVGDTLQEHIEFVVLRIDLSKQFELVHCTASVMEKEISIRDDLMWQNILIVFEQCLPRCSLRNTIVASLKDI